MLPTTGYFKNIDCPYYEEACDRPYCHFKHRKKIHETIEAATAATVALSEVPTYNPTPKSQLASVRSHIPISYVPDLAVRSERNSFRSVSSYGYGGDKPTYKPTPLSMLSTNKVNNEVAGSNESAQCAKYSPTLQQDDIEEIDFEDLETEFDMIDELISDSDVINGENKSAQNVVINKPETTVELTKSKHHKHSSNSNSSIKLKVDHKKYNGESSKSKSNSKSKSGSRSSDKAKTESKHKDNKLSKSAKSSDSKKKITSSSSSKSENKKTSSKSDNKVNKHDSKKKSSSKHKENSSERNTKKIETKSKERDKEKRSSDKKKEPSTKKETTTSQPPPTKTEIKIVLENDSSNDYEGNDTYLSDNDSDLETNTLEECFKIFNEYKPTEPHIFSQIKEDSEEGNLDDEMISTNLQALQNRKRIAHDNATHTHTKIAYNKPKTRPNVAQTMVNRLKAARIAYANNEQNNIINEMNKHNLKRPSETVVEPVKKIQKMVVSRTVKPSTSLVDDILTGKTTATKARRIAPVQNVNSFQKAKARIEEITKMRTVKAIVKTAAQSTNRSTKRVAHIPDQVNEIPDLLAAERSKLPVNVRTRYLTMIVDECAKLYLSRDEAHQRAVNEEYKCYERCAALVTYRNSAMLAINRLRKELHERELSGLGPILPGETVGSAKDDACELKGIKFYNTIKRYILIEEELILHGFPREGTMPGHAVVNTQKKPVKGYLGEDERICCRCSKHYKVDEDGLALYEEECIYHPLKKRTFRGESVYLCCKSGEGTGCVTSPTHVSDTLYTEGEIEGYQTTMLPEYDDDPRSYEVFALDCEMCYTTKGLELTRVTIVNSDCKTVYESLVKPLNRIVDYNTRFSGITEEQMNRTATSILQVQANILHLCNANTILIGHSLESDMKALKIIHSSVIDTSVLFPHKFGLPHKRALRDLAREYLKKIIQNDISGHDSAEDALTCMELVQWKIKEDFKTRGIKV